jgi:O-antigen/teichoic acid export membrane protein
VWALVIGQALTVLLNHLALKEETAFHHIPILWRSASSEWKVLWTFSFPAVLSGALSGPVNWAANSIFVNEAQGYSTMGVFSAANQFRQFILFTPGVMAGVLLPILSSLRGVRADDQYTRVFKANLLLSASCSLFVAIPIALLAPWIMAGYGDAFRAGSSVLIILAAVGVLMATINVVGQAMASEERMWGGFVLNAIWALVFLVCCYSLRHRGAVGLAGANLVAYTVHLATVSLYVRYCLSTQSYRSRENYVAT